MYPETKQALAISLLQIDAIRFGQFRLKLHEKHPEAPLSPIYIDLRRLRSFPRTMDDTVRMYIELAAGLKFDCYADVPTAATPIVAVLSHETRIPMITPRTGQKSRGIGSSIDGAFKKNQVALLVDDLVTYADSKLEAIAVLEANGLTVRDVVVLLNRNQGGSEELNKHGYSCHAAFGLRELIDFYYTSKMITEENYSRTNEYLDTSGFTRQPV